MKTFMKYAFLCWSGLWLILLLTGCSDDDNPGEVFVELAAASYHEALFTRISESEVRDEIYIRIGVTFKNASSSSNLGIYKILLDGSGQELSRAIAMENIESDTYTRLTIETGEVLFNGLGITQHEIQSDHSFRFVTFKSSPGSQPEIIGNSYEFKPEYNALEFNVNYNPSSVGHVDFIRTSDTNIKADVNINLNFTIEVENEDAEEFENIGLTKHLFDAQGAEIGSTTVLQNIPANTETSLIITDIATLFEGIEYDYNTNLDGPYTFSFTAFAETKSMETVIMDDIFETTATFEVRILPILETGTTWIVTNNITGLSKEVQLFSVQEELGVASSEYFFTDFGIDWSWWNDFWYGTSFSIDFPEVEGDPFVIVLGGYSGDTGLFYDGLADDGITVENRQLRLMGYTYQDGSPKGEFEEATQTITFNSVNILDWWWGVDSHSNVSMTFVKQP